MSRSTPGRSLNSAALPHPLREEDGMPVHHGGAPPAVPPAMQAAHPLHAPHPPQALHAPYPPPLHAPYPVALAGRPPVLTLGPPGYQPPAAYYPQHVPPRPHAGHPLPQMQALQHGGHPYYMQHPFAGPPGLYHAQPPYPQYGPPAPAMQVAAPRFQPMPAGYMQHDVPPANAPAPSRPAKRAPKSHDSDVPQPSNSKRPAPHRHYPNVQSQPEVWVFETGVTAGNSRRVFTATTAATWNEFRADALQRFGVPEKDVQMVWKLGGESARFLLLSNEADWKEVINRITTKALSAKTRAASLEIKNIAKSSSEKPSSKKGKRRRQDLDQTSDAEVELTSNQRALETLRQATRCEAHDGHCWVRKGASVENHMRMSHAHMTLWAKHISEGLATTFQPPNVQDFDPQPTRRARSTQGSPDVYVTMNFATPSPDQASYSSVPTAYAVSANGDASQAQTMSVLRGSTEDDHVKLPYPLNGRSPPPGPPLPFPPLPRGWTSRYPLSESRSLSPSSVAGPSHPKSARGLQAIQDIPYPRIIFPSIEHLTEHLQVIDPEYDYSALLEELNEMGHTDVQELLTIPVELLANMGNNLGQERANNLRKCARRIILPAFLGDSDSDSDRIADAAISQSAETGQAPAKRRKVATTPTNTSPSVKLESEDVKLHWSDIDQENVQVAEDVGGHSESSNWDGSEGSSSWIESEIDELEDDTN